MTANAFESSIEGIRSVWGPLSTKVVAGCARYLERLVNAPATEEGLSALHREAPANQELYRDPTHGFVLLAHTEYAGLYRPPHDHGRGWVIYAMQQGEWMLVNYYNEGLQYHPMHLHQFPQLVVARDGIPLDQPYYADTISVGPGERYTVLFQADKPGVWVWHCHILNHAEREEGMFGMVTAVAVTQ